MTVKEIAKYTGFSTHTIYKFIRDGEINATLVKTNHGTKTDVDPAYIPALRERKVSGVVGKPAIVKVERITLNEKKKQALRDAVVDLMNYNEKYNKHLSYGQATAMGII